MLHRSTIIHKDSLGRATTLEGDSIVYDNANRVSHAYQYRDITKLSQPTIITDTANKLILISAYGMYNDSTKEAFATGYPLLKEYSRPDTLFLRADTIFTYIRQDTIREPKFYPERFVAEPFSAQNFEYLEVTFYDDEDLLPPITKGEMQGLLNTMLAQIKLEHTPPKPELPEESNAEQKDSLRFIEMVDSVLVVDPVDSALLKMTVDSVDLSLPVDSLGKPLVTIAPDSLSHESETLGSVALSSLEGSRSRPRAATEETEKKEPEIEMIIKEIRDYHVAKAYPRARFFNQDIQGVADTLEIYENDSLMFMKRKPVVWNSNRQVNGEVIILHFNDTTVDYAELPKSGFMAEHVDEDFYNQLSGKKMEAWFDDSYLKRLFVDGNVQVIMLPMENDSSYNKLVDAESSYMDVELADKQVQKIRMWPEVTGNATPIFLVKKAQKYLPGFRWLEALRPKRVEIEGVIRWDDELGEIPEALEEYFAN